MKPASAERCALTESGVTKAIVGGSFIGVHQHVVSFAKFLESLFRLRVVRILVRMKLHREFAVGALHFFRRGGAFDTEHLVIVALLNSSHSGRVMVDV
jgi:hypothetical protein